MCARLTGTGRVRKILRLATSFDGKCSQTSRQDESNGINSPVIPCSWIARFSLILKAAYAGPIFTPKEPQKLLKTPGSRWSYRFSGMNLSRGTVGSLRTYTTPITFIIEFSFRRAKNKRNISIDWLAFVPMKIVRTVPFCGAPSNRQIFLQTKA